MLEGREAEIPGDIVVTRNLEERELTSGANHAGVRLGQHGHLVTVMIRIGYAQGARVGSP